MTTDGTRPTSSNLDPRKQCWVGRLPIDVQGHPYEGWVLSYVSGSSDPLQALASKRVKTCLSRTLRWTQCVHADRSRAAGAACVELLARSIHRAQIAAAVAPIGADGKPDITNPLTAAEKAVVKSRILAACDAADGALDGMVSRISACRPDPAQWVCTGGNTSNCLPANKADYVAKFFEGAKTQSGTRIYGPWPYDPGMVGTLGTPSSFFYGIFAGEASHVYTTPPTVTPDLLTYARTADLDAEYAKIFAVSGIYTRSGRDFTNADNPNMDAFRARKSKILMSDGTADLALPFNDLTDYYTKVQTRYGANEAADFARAFAVPGMDHCSGGADAPTSSTPMVPW